MAYLTAGMDVATTQNSSYVVVRQYTAALPTPAVALQATTQATTYRILNNGQTMREAPPNVASAGGGGTRAYAWS